MKTDVLLSVLLAHAVSVGAHSFSLFEASLQFGLSQVVRASGRLSVQFGCLVAIH